MTDISKLKFDDKGLIPAIVVDAYSKKVLTLPRDIAAPFCSLIAPR